MEQPLVIWQGDVELDRRRAVGRVILDWPRLHFEWSIRRDGLGQQVWEPAPGYFTEFLLHAAQALAVMHEAAERERIRPFERMPS